MQLNTLRNYSIYDTKVKNLKDTNASKCTTISETVTTMEAYNSLRSLKVRKAPGPDGIVSFSYPEPFLRAVRRGALAKSIFRTGI